MGPTQDALNAQLRTKLPHRKTNQATTQEDSNYLILAIVFITLIFLVVYIWSLEAIAASQFFSIIHIEVRYYKNELGMCYDLQGVFIINE